MELEYSNVCRLCAGSCENFFLIFEKTGPTNFAEKIKLYLHVEIPNLNDAHYEPRMCHSCCEKIVDWDQYAEQVQKVQGMFTTLASRGNKKTNNSSTGNENSHLIPVVSPVSNEFEKNFTNENATAFARQKRKKSKILKKKKRINANDKQNSDFSDEDNIPLVNCTDNNLREALINKLIDTNSNETSRGLKSNAKPFKTDINCQKIEKKEKEESGQPDDLSSIEDEGFTERNENDTGLQSLLVWECLKCSEPSKNWNALVKHCREKHDINASVQCICGKLLQSRASIMKHRMKHTIGFEYKCTFENCSKTFHRQHLLDVHSLSHVPKELQPWMCCKCSRRFHTESLLKQHEKVHLPKEEKLIHPCEICQKKFCSKSAVSAHLRAVHFGERPFVCDQCGHSFTSKGILQEHLTIHSNVCNFHCKDCNKSFKTKYRLKIHMDTHMETRYQCPTCNLTLNTRRTLRMHLLVHRDDKSFQCNTCGKAFKRSKDLKNHYNLHTGRRPYTCLFCQRTFANGSNCRSHKRRMHPEELKMYEAGLASTFSQKQSFNALSENVKMKTTLDSVGVQTNESEFPGESNESESNVSGLKGTNGENVLGTEIGYRVCDVISSNLQRNDNEEKEESVWSQKRKKDEQEKKVKEKEKGNSKESPEMAENFAQIDLGSHATSIIQFPVNTVCGFLPSPGIPPSLNIHF